VLHGAPGVAGLTRLRAEVWVMFHEVAYPFEAGQPLKLRARALETHLYAWGLERRADRVLVSTPACERALTRLSVRPKPAVWLPIPSNLPTSLPSFERRRVLESYGLDPERPVVGHFSSFGGRVAEMLEPALAQILALHDTAQILLIGTGSVAFAERFGRVRRDHAARVRVAGRLEELAAAEAIAASDLLICPFPDGVTSRRTSVMAALALGKAVVTNFGPNSETLFRRERPVELVERPEELAAAVVALLGDPERRERLGQRAREIYDQRFALERVVAVLRRLRHHGERATAV
jgi:glycosyltransferase involved in cell wall biosynthesis